MLRTLWGLKEPIQHVANPSDVAASAICSNAIETLIEEYGWLHRFMRLFVQLHATMMTGAWPTNS